MEISNEASAFAAAPNFLGFKPLHASIGRQTLSPPGFDEIVRGRKEPTGPSSFAYFNNEYACIEASYHHNYDSYTAQVNAMAPFTPPEILEAYRNDIDAFASNTAELQLRCLLANMEMQGASPTAPKRDLNQPLQKPVPLAYNKFNYMDGGMGDGTIPPAPGTVGPYSSEDLEVQAFLGQRTDRYTPVYSASSEDTEMCDQCLNREFKRLCDSWAPIPFPPSRGDF